MAEIIRNRTIRPSTRQETSPNYRVAINGITPTVILEVNIKHEGKHFSKTFRFRGDDIVKKKNPGFTATEIGNNIQIHWASHNQ